MLSHFRTPKLIATWTDGHTFTNCLWLLILKANRIVGITHVPEILLRNATEHLE
jgi:hypothetical protein